MAATDKTEYARAIVAKLTGRNHTMTKIKLNDRNTTPQDLEWILSTLITHHKYIIKLSVHLVAFTQQARYLLEQFLCATKTLGTLKIVYSFCKYNRVHFAVARALQTNTTIQNVIVQYVGDCKYKLRPVIFDAFMCAVATNYHRSDSVWILDAQSQTNHFPLMLVDAERHRAQPVCFCMGEQPMRRGSKVVQDAAWHVLIRDPAFTCVTLDQRTGTPQDHVAILDVLNLTDDHVTDLHLRYYDSAPPEEVLDALFECVWNSTTLTTLDVTNCNLTDDMIAHVFSAFTWNASVRTVRAFYNSPSSEDALIDRVSAIVIVSRGQHCRFPNTRWELFHPGVNEHARVLEHAALFLARSPSASK